MSHASRRIIKELAKPGDRVQKRSGKPFKSKEKVNTVKEVVSHPHLADTLAYTFLEDASTVQASYCEIVKGDATC